MSQPVIDRSKCLKDGICTRVCPVTVLRPSADGYPEATNGSCVACGHCVSVCPKGAISLGSVKPEALEILQSDWRLDPERVSQLLKGRRSIRAFRDEPLPRDAIAKMIELAQYAPSGMNAQPIAWTVIYDRAGVRAVGEATANWMRRAVTEKHPLAAAYDLSRIVNAWENGVDPICRNAPHLVVAHAHGALPTGAMAGAISTTYLELAALPVGAGTCWAGFVFAAASYSPEVAATLGVPEGRRCSGVVMAGRPAVKYLRIPERRAPQIAWR